MKARWAKSGLMLIALIAAVAFALFVVSPTQAQKSSGTTGKTAETVQKSKYLVVSPHTAEECLAALDGVLAEGKETLNNYEWGCMAGDHTGYTFVDATSEAEALKAVPTSIRGKAKAIRMNKFTADQILSFHEKH